MLIVFLALCLQGQVFLFFCSFVSTWVLWCPADECDPFCMWIERSVNHSWIVDCLSSSCVRNGGVGLASRPFNESFDFPVKEKTCSSLNGRIRTTHQIILFYPGQNRTTELSASRTFGLSYELICSLRNIQLLDFLSIYIPSEWTFVLFVSFSIVFLTPVWGYMGPCSTNWLIITI